MNLKNYNHIIWDWNGTLLNDVDMCVNSMNFLLKKYNKPLINKEIYRSIFDFPVKDYYEKAGFDFNVLDFSIVGMEFIKKYNSQVKEQDLYANAKEIVHFFSQKNRTQIILSAREQEQLENEIAHFELLPYISQIIGLNNNFAFGKIENGINYLKNNKIEALKTILIGDTTHDADVAKAMQIDCILIANGHQTKEKLEKANVPIIDNIQDLIKFF
jgi:phosphoglycolate phosphatase